MVYEVNELRTTLCHEGIKGMRWGIQNGPPYPLNRQLSKAIKAQQKEADKLANTGVRDDIYRQKHTIPAGTTMYRVTPGKEAHADGTTYVTYLEPDRRHYRGGWIRSNGNTGKAYEHTFTLKKDLTVPSRQELKEVINQVVRQNKANIDATVNSWFDIVYGGRAGDVLAYMAAEQGKSQKQIVNQNIKNFMKMSVDDAYYFTAQSLGKNLGVREQVINELKRRGYNAMVDEASVGGQSGWGREGVDPLIIFDGSDTLYQRNTSRISSWSEANDHAKDAHWQSVATYKNRDAAWSAI